VVAFEKRMVHGKGCPGGVVCGDWSTWVVSSNPDLLQGRCIVVNVFSKFGFLLNT
jgi:hypothetical protein